MSGDLDELWKGASDIPFLHIYGQYQWHAPATIRGNRQALMLLSEAINRALSENQAEASVTATDGEGYGLKVICSEVVSVIGTPEYLYQLEYKMGERAAERDKAFKLSAAS